MNASGIAGHSTYFNGCPIYIMGRLESISGLTISFSSGKFIQAGGLHTGHYTLLVLKLLGILKTWLGFVFNLSVHGNKESRCGTVTIAG